MLVYFKSRLRQAPPIHAVNHAHDRCSKMKSLCLECWKSLISPCCKAKVNVLKCAHYYFATFWFKKCPFVNETFLEIAFGFRTHCVYQPIVDITSKPHTRASPRTLSRALRRSTRARVCSFQSRMPSLTRVPKNRDTFETRGR